jgi:DNA mismatch repair protein MutS
VPRVRERIDQTLVEDAPTGTAKGGLIRDGYHEEVDRLRTISRDGKGWMAKFEAAEKVRTGISGLKIGYNKVFGYYLEASRAAADKIPDSYERKQTLANAERYITEELKQREAEVLGAEERLVTLEAHLFRELTEQVATSLDAIAGTAAALAELDAVCGFAEVAHTARFVRPEIAADGILDIVEGRHPVVEHAIGSRFVPNDCRLGPDQTSLMVITGPNMAGKSTYLRQVALVTLLAHCGCFVPATRARVPLVDRIFTRIGASDNLVRGQSTFMVEMSETANILANMSPRSLVVLDEIGRGTSTFDGISIAWAVAEEMVRGRVKTLFATHYHELATLAEEHDAVANFSVAVRRYKGEIVFLYRVTAGAASGSFGIEVARLAGLPEAVIEDARRLLARFESGESPVAGSGGSGVPQQTNLFDIPSRTAPLAKSRDLPKDPVIQALIEVSVEETTPVEALVLLERLVRDVRNRQ